jgi:hypothetical protein
MQKKKGFAQKDPDAKEQPNTLYEEKDEETEILDETPPLALDRDVLCDECANDTFTCPWFDPAELLESGVSGINGHRFVATIATGCRAIALLPDNQH